MAEITARALQHFWDKVDKTAPGGCWLWNASKTRDGYGTFRAQGQTYRAHRFAYLMLSGAIPDGLHLDHLCRVRSCVNPAHLEPVTHRENILRGDTLPAANVRKTHCPAGHAYDESNTIRERSGRRRCRQCARVNQKRSRSLRRNRVAETA